MSKDGRRCVFCGGGGKLTREHVWPRWLESVLGTSRPHPVHVFLREGRPWRRPWTAPDFSITARVVCRDCNGGWMSALESAAKPLLTPMIEASQRVALTPQGQRVVGAWSLKTAMMMQQAEGADQSIPPRDYGWVYKHGEPPIGVQVLLGQFVPEESQIRYDHQPIASEDLVDGTRRTEGYGIMLGVGHLLVHINSPGLDPPDPQVRLPLKGRLAQHLIEIGPGQTTVTWPPQYRLPADGIDDLFRGLTGRGSAGPIGDKLAAAKMGIGRRRGRRRARKQRQPG